MPSLPAALEGVLMPFAPLFRRPVWRRAQVLLMGAILSPGRRTVTQALRVVGLGGERHFPSYRWSSASMTPSNAGGDARSRRAGSTGIR